MQVAETFVVYKGRVLGFDEYHNEQQAAKQQKQSRNKMAAGDFHGGFSDGQKYESPGLFLGWGDCVCG